MEKEIVHEKKSLLTKAGKGLTVNDVANSSIRNILGKLMKIEESELKETEEHFGWKCPYTGQDLRERIEKKEDVVLDHIVPQNKDYCGLNVKGNLIYVDKTANSKKGTKTVEEFLIDDKAGFFSDTPMEVREERLAKIKAFQKKCGYDPEGVQRKLAAKLEEVYREIANNQNILIKDIMTLLDV